MADEPLQSDDRGASPRGSGDPSTVKAKAESRLKALRKERRNRNADWMELRDYVMPRAGYWENAQSDRSAEHFGEKILDGHATKSNRILSSGMESGLTSHSNRWFERKFSDDAANEDRSAREWLYRQVSRMYAVIDGSNLYQMLPGVYDELGCFGNASLQIDWHPESVIHCTHHTVGSYYWAKNPDGRVDTIYVEYQWTVDQLVQKYGEERVSRRTAESYRQGLYDKTVDCVWAIEPNTDGSAKIPEEMKFRSVRYEKGSESHEVLSVSGYYEFPVATPRWRTTGGSAYATSWPGIDALPDIRQLQLEREFKNEALDKVIRPPLNAPSTLQNAGVSIIAGDVNYIDPMHGDQRISPVYSVKPDLAALREDMQVLHASVDGYFYADLFQMMHLNDGPESGRSQRPTAREVSELHAEKLVQLLPVLEGLFPDLLEVIVDRVWSIMDRFGLIDPPPPGLDGLVIETVFTSTLANAAQLIENVKIEQGLSFVGGLSGVLPEVLDNINGDEAVTRYFDNLVMPPDIVREEREVQAIRQARAEKIAQAEQAAQASEAAAGAKVLSEARPDDSNILGQLMSGLGPV